jgi:hypothetical protein
MMRAARHPNGSAGRLAISGAFAVRDLRVRRAVGRRRRHRTQVDLDLDDMGMGRRIDRLAGKVTMRYDVGIGASRSAPGDAAADRWAG